MFFLFRSVPFRSRSVWVNNSSICKIYYVIWLRNESSSVWLFQTKISKESEKPKNQNTKSTQNKKKIPEITKYLKDQNLTQEPKISNILNIFLNFESLPKTWNNKRKRESKFYYNIFILRTYMDYWNIHNMNKTFWVLWVRGIQQRPAGPKKSNRYFFPNPEPQHVFRICLVHLSNLGKIFILKKELHKSVYKKYLE